MSYSSNVQIPSSGTNSRRGEALVGRLLCCCLILALLTVPAPPAAIPAAGKASGPAVGSETRSPIPVFVTILPQAYFVARIGGRHVQTSVLVGAGQSPHSYEPTPQQMARMADARAYFCIGVPMEAAVLKKIRKLNGRLMIVETQRGVPYRYLEADRHEHDHEADPDHAGTAHPATAPDGAYRYGGGSAPGLRGGGVPVGETETRGRQAPSRPTGRHRTPDPHIWLDPGLVKIQARNIHDALCRLDPSHQEEYGANLRDFAADLERLHNRIARTLAPLRGKKMYVFHPAFGYFAAAYGLIQVPVESGGREPSARQLASLIAAARKDGVKVIFVQAQFPAKSAAAVARAIGGAVVPVDPLARNYLENLQRLTDAVAAGLR